DACHCFTLAVAADGIRRSTPGASIEINQATRHLNCLIDMRPRTSRASRRSVVTEGGFWRPLSALCDPTLPKLDNLRRARCAGILVPEPTLWAYAADVERGSSTDLSEICRRTGMPCIVRSISPTEDTARSSQAGRFVSRVVCRMDAMADALARVVASLPLSE